MLSLVSRGVLFLTLGFSGAHSANDLSIDQDRPNVKSSSLEGKKPMKLTPVSDEDLWMILEESHYNVKKTRPPKELLIGAWAHIMLENAHGKKVWNNNIGNVGNLPTEPQDEYYSHFGKTRYRSFDSVVSGAEAYWNMLYRCPLAIKYFKTRNAEAAGLSLKRCNYYRSEQEAYSQILTTLYERGSRISRSREGSR